MSVIYAFDLTCCCVFYKEFHLGVHLKGDSLNLSIVSIVRRIVTEDLKMRKVLFESS